MKCDDNARMISQQGLFTVSRSCHNIREWVSANYYPIRRRMKARIDRDRGKRRQSLEYNRKALQANLDSRWILLRIDIETTEKDRKQILKWLNRMNINHATLYLDVEGAALYANMQGDIYHY